MKIATGLRAGAAALSLTVVLVLTGCDAEEEEGAAPVRPVRAVTADLMESGETVSVVSCSRPNGTPTSLEYRLVTTFTFVRWEDLG